MNPAPPVPQKHEDKEECTNMIRIHSEIIGVIEIKIQHVWRTGEGQTS